MPHFDDDLFLGGAITQEGTDPSLGNSSPMSRGVGPMGRVYVFDIIPLAQQAAGLAALQTTAGAGNLALTAGAGVTNAIGPDGVRRYVLDTPRNVSLASIGNLSGVNFTVVGYDFYGKPMTQVIAGPNNSTVSTTKAFRSVTQISASGAVGTNVSVGYGDIFGLPVRVTDAGYIVRAGWDGALAGNAGTFSPSVTTDPATPTTGDVRGTFAPSSAANGSRRLVMVIAIPAIGSGPNATRAGALGVDQA